MGMVAWPLWGGLRDGRRGCSPWVSPASPAGVRSPPPAAWTVGGSASSGTPLAAPTDLPSHGLDSPPQRQRPLSSRPQEPDGQTGTWVSLPGLPGGQAASHGGGFASHVTQRGGRRPSFSQERRALGPRDTPSSAQFQ